MADARAEFNFNERKNQRCVTQLDVLLSIRKH